jgi:hypothetical protein
VLHAVIGWQSAHIPSLDIGAKSVRVPRLAWPAGPAGVARTAGTASVARANKCCSTPASKETDGDGSAYLEQLVPGGEAHLASDVLGQHGGVVDDKGVKDVKCQIRRHGRCHQRVQPLIVLSDTCTGRSDTHTHACTTHTHTHTRGCKLRTW